MTDPTPGAAPAARAEEPPGDAPGGHPVRDDAQQDDAQSDGQGAARHPADGAAAGPASADGGTGSPPAADGTEGPRPLGVAVRPSGDAAVDALLARLSATDHLGVAGHREVYEDVHGGLRDALAALDRPPGPTPRAAPHPPHTSRS